MSLDGAQVRLIHFLFSFEGRINRESCWLFIGSCFALSIVLEFAIRALTGSQAMIFWLILLWPVLAVFGHSQDTVGVSCQLRFPQTASCLLRGAMMRP